MEAPTNGWTVAAFRAAEEMRQLSEQAGSTLTHARDGTSTVLKRVVQVVDTRETQAFPRAVTSEQGKPGTEDLLRRGDAVLYALGDDDFRPGDLVTWQGRPWVVVGLLGVEMAGDVRVYQEVGLRRLPVTVMARVRGTIANMT